MTYIKREQLNILFEKQVARCRNVLNGKAAEYTGGKENRLCAFKAASALQHCTPEQALAGMLAKHIVSICDLCAAPSRSFAPEVWDEKITDSLNYLFLLKALTEENKAGSD